MPRQRSVRRAAKMDNGANNKSRFQACGPATEKALEPAQQYGWGESRDFRVNDATSDAVKSRKVNW